MLAHTPLLNMLLALAITLTLMLGLALLLRAVTPHLRTRTSPGKRLAKLESLPLTPQHTLHLVTLDGELHALVTTPQSAYSIPLVSNKKSSV